MKEKLRITSIGDSISAGTSVVKLGPFSKDSFPHLLAEALGAELSNPAIPGVTSGEAVIQARLAKPSDIITILIGANDCFYNLGAERYERNLSAAVEIAKVKAKKVFVIGLPNISLLQALQEKRQLGMVASLVSVFTPPKEMVQRFSKFDAIAEKVAKEKRVGFISMQGFGLKKEDLGADNFHPGKKFHQLVLKKLLSRLRRTAVKR